MGKVVRVMGIAAPFAVVAAATVALWNRRPAMEASSGAQELHGGVFGPKVDSPQDPAAVISPERADAPGEPVRGLTASPPAPIRAKVVAPLDRALLHARGALSEKAVLRPSALRAATVFNNETWGGDLRRELLTYLRAHDVSADASFTDADASVVARLQVGGGASVDGMLRDTTMAVLFAAGFDFSARKAKVWEVAMEFFPGEIEDEAEWNATIAKVVTKGGVFHDLDVPDGEGRIYVRVGKVIVGAYRARGGPPKPVDDFGGHVAAPSKPGSYKLGWAHAHVTNAWYHSQIPWGAEIRESGGGFQYRSATWASWAWATKNDRCILKEPFDADDFDDLKQGKRDGETVWTWNKNDFGPIAWNLASSDLYVHTTPDTETDSEKGDQTILLPSHGCVHIDPGERDDMIARGYLRKDVPFVIRDFDEHLLPPTSRSEMRRNRK